MYLMFVPEAIKISYFVFRLISMYPLINDMGRHLRLQPIYPFFSDTMMIKSLWFVNFKTLKLQPERPGSSCTKQEKQFHGNLQPVWYNEKKSSLWRSWVIPPHRRLL